jgi:sec-independent protein translocase protein TatA
MPDIGPMEIILVLGVILLLFGGRKLPELARGSGRALRIFRSEMRQTEADEKAVESGASEATPTVHEAEVVEDDTTK